MTPKQLWQLFEKHFVACKGCRLDTYCFEGMKLREAYEKAVRASQ